MKRSPIVAVGTVVGLASVLSFHSSPAKINLSTVSNVAPSSTTTTTSKKSTSTTVAPTTTAPPTTTTTSTRHQNSATTTSAPTTTTAPPTTTSTPPTTTSTSAATTGVRTVTGPLVNYFYGVLSVKVTANGKKITAVTIGSITDGGNPRSQQIDQYSVPILAQEAMAAQSSSIQSISGASYTSAGFQMSLQYALKKLGL